MHTISRVWLCLMVIAGWNLLPAQELLYYVDVCTFYDQDGKPYLEFYLDVDVNSLEMQPQESGSFTGAVDVDLAVTTEAGIPIYKREFSLLSPPVQDTSAKGRSFGIMDVRRISLDPGKYIFTGHLKDGNSPTPKVHKFVREFELQVQPSGFASLSEIEFIQSFQKSEGVQAHSKHGYDILPFVTNSTYLDADSVKYYLEAYHTDRESEEVFFINSYITLANSDSKLPGAQKVMRQAVGPLSVIQGGFDISKLPSQSYFLHVDLYSKKQEPIASASKKFFLSNSRVETPVSASEIPFDEVFNLDEDELTYYIHTLYLVSSNTEVEFARSLETKEQKENYFVNYWSKRRKRPSDSPSKPFMAHKNRVQYANDNYKAAHLEGWRTDRGRIILQHGPPNDIERFPSSSTNFPYVIWRYNKIKTQPNVRFVFYNPNIAIDEYVLLHSNLLGEINNPRWQYEIMRTTQDNNLDNEQLFDNFNGER